MIRRFAAVVMLVVVAAPALAMESSVSVTIGQPGFYGRIDVTDFPPPVLLYAEPLVAVPGPAGTVGRPIYLYVPPKHAKDWRKQCRKYHACGQPVYFVQDNWYREVYVPEYRARKVKEDRKKEDKGKKQ